jgi:hypothetical protein
MSYEPPILALYSQFAYCIWCISDTTTFDGHYLGSIQIAFQKKKKQNLSDFDTVESRDTLGYNLRCSNTTWTLLFEKETPQFLWCDMQTSTEHFLISELVHFNEQFYSMPTTISTCTTFFIFRLLHTCGFKYLQQNFLLSQLYFLHNCHFLFYNFTPKSKHKTSNWNQI